MCSLHSTLYKQKLRLFRLTVDHLVHVEQLIRLSVVQLSSILKGKVNIFLSMITRYALIKT